MKGAFIAAVLLVLAPPPTEPTLATGSISEAAQKLKPGEYLWAPDIAPDGPLLLVVSLKSQRAIIYRNGIPIGISTVSTGRKGYETPTGVFTVLQRHVEHYSSKYDNAPMPYMQRLTWGGIALHGGNLPGYPASHGCIRLPTQFARLLYGETKLGMTVVVTNEAVVPRIAPAESLLGRSIGLITTGDVWQPSLAPDGPVSIVISGGDRRMVVLRNGTVIGRSAVKIDGPLTQTSAYVMGADRQSWVRIGLPGQDGAVTEKLRGRIHASDMVRQQVEAILKPGTTVVVTPDSLTASEAGRPMTVIENEEDVQRD
jgi:hypothetical protein